MSRKSAAIVATVPTGFEPCGVEEVREKFKAVSEVQRGRIFFEADESYWSELGKLRSVDHLAVVIFREDDFKFADTKDDCLAQLMSISSKCDWELGLDVWRATADLRKIAPPTSSAAANGNSGKTAPPSAAANENTESRILDSPDLDMDCSVEPGTTSRPSKDTKENPDCCLTEDEKYSSEDARCLPGDSGLAFRVTCNRASKNEFKHLFTSMEAACAFGDIVNTEKGWKVDLTNFDVEVILTVNVYQVYVSLALTHVGLFRRNLVAFGPTTLRPTICYGLIRWAILASFGRESYLYAFNACRLLDPKPGDVILDPLCGTGSIPIEGAVAYPSCYWLASDCDDRAVARVATNLGEHSDPHFGVADALQCDVTSIPFHRKFIDKVVTDLPFGKRVGSRTDNRTLYPKLLESLNMVTTNSAIGVFLTWDKRNFVKAIQSDTGWRLLRNFTSNVGGLPATVFVLKKSA